MLTGPYWTGPYFLTYLALLVLTGLATGLTDSTLNLLFPSVVFQATGYGLEEFGEFCIGEVCSGLCIMDELVMVEI